MTTPAENPELPAPTTPVEPPAPTEFQNELDGVLESLEKTEKNIAQLRAFIEKWKGALLMCESWNAGPTHNPTITISRPYGEEAGKRFDPKKIARAFGADGWKRVKHPYTCGHLNWQKTVDDVEIDICGAEVIELKPREDVRL